MENERKVIIAKRLSAYDIKHMYDSVSSMQGLCPVCHNVLRKIPNRDYNIGRHPNSDVFFTYDGFLIVSQKFRDFCLRNEYSGLHFDELPQSYGYYHMLIDNIYKLDYERSRTLFLNKRDCCGSYDEIIGWDPSFRAKDNILDERADGFYRAEYLGGSFSDKSIEPVIGLVTYKKMIKEKFRGIIYLNVYI